MEVIEGGNWGSQIGVPQSPHEVRRVLASALRALAHLHSHGEVHGDLKPGNILLGRGGVVKVTDVGMGGGTGGEDALTGTPGYAAPEVWEGAKPDARSDLYSSGVIAYEALTGRHPFAGRTVKEVVSGQLEGWVPSPRSHGVQVPADLERAVMRALERNPALRHSNADELLEDMSVTDRVGDLLGGKIVARDQELGDLEALIQEHPSRAPTVVFITGPPGVGKTAFLEELSQRLSTDGGAIVRATAGTASAVSEAVSKIAIKDLANSTANSKGASLSAVVGLIERVSDRTPLLVIFDVQDGGEGQAAEFVRALGRFIWALSIERSRGFPVLLCIELSTAPSDLEEFEKHIALAPLTVDQMSEFMAGTLGKVNLEPEVLKRVESVTGGSPKALRALVTDLIDRGLLHRSGGTWRFREVEHLHSLASLGAASRWSLAWGHLASDQHEVLAVLSLLPNGLAAADLRVVIERADDLLPGLASKGWIRAAGGTWTLASDEIRSTIADLIEDQDTGPVEERLLAMPKNNLTREERASILLRIGHRQEALTEGLWAAEQSMARGDYRLARERAGKCLELSVGDVSASRRAVLIIGEALHQSGKDEDAGNILASSDIWACSPAATSESARREHLLGTIRRSQGRNPEAKAHLSRAVGLAEGAGEFAIALRAHADLAEIDWRHGDTGARTAAIDRVRSVLAREYGDLPINEERAALAYQLGSALIQAGDREEAQRVLKKALELDPGDYWRMRLANAQVSACYYLGEFKEALDWLDEAWRCAERSGIDAFKARILSNRAGLFYGLGRFRDAVETHELSAHWGRRTGNEYEFLAARAGGSINLTLLGRYEEAVELAREAFDVAQRIGSFHECAKALELEALASFHIGDYVEANRLVHSAMERVQDIGFDDVQPRLDWLAARLNAVNGNLDAAEASLQAALEVLVRTKDWEDLPGVQIEMQRVFFRKKDPRFRLEELRRFALAAKRGGALIVYLYGAIVMAEIVMADGIDDGEGGEFLLDALGRAEESGAAEIGWRLSYVLGELAIRKADMRGASARFAHAVRRLGEVADRLTPEHRRLYLKTAHARRLLERASAATQTG